ncbi:aldose 1-epimerase [Hymenobacter sp. PAMC 26628]|uniref:aldose 1-epimerase n=1 Tax=Hymenobacter sp. PAMC 26628 TaxID=1484118 RepID=UPI001F24DBFD|nr:hypothetical protein [Hymenobacter sp. PAMC 26628]
MHELLLHHEGQVQAVLRTPATHEEYEAWGRQGYYGAKLFPFPGRIRNAQYDWGPGQGQQLVANDTPRPHALHGLVYGQPFAVSDRQASASHGLLTLTHHADGSAPGYPFPFELAITYRLDSDGLSCTTRATNTGATPMPVGDGWHPYILTESGATDTQLQFESQGELLLSADYLPTGQQRAHNRFAALTAIGPPGDLHECHALALQAGIHRTWVHDPARQLTVEVWQETGPGKYNYLQLYVPPDQHSVAVEPYTCPSDAFNSGVGLITLVPGETSHWRMGLRLVP